MKKAILFLFAIGFITMAATLKPSKSISETIRSKNSTLIENKYKECIDACNACSAACKKCETHCEKSKDPKMARCIQLCKECIVACDAASKLMTLNSESVKEMCMLCANICDKCAAECEKFNSDHCNECAKACRKTAKLCREM